jgi:hypothetical protein
MAVTYSRAANPIWYFPDLEGSPLNDEYYAFFLTNTFPYIPQAVFQDPDGTIPWNNPIEFFPNGTLPDNLYFNDGEVYRIEIRHGNTQADPLIYEINNFIPSGNTGGGSSTVQAGFGENQATMSQFSEVNFVSPLAITTAGTYSVAPGWDLVLTGIGTATITQTPIAGDQNFVNNPTYALGLNLNGWSTANLVQRFNHNGDIWASTLLSGIPNQDGYISMSITAQAVGSAYSPISFIYKNSVGTEQNIGNAGSINTGSYQVYNQTQLLDISDNSDTSDVAFVDIIIQLLGTGNILISNIQIVGQEVATGTTAPTSPVYQQQSNERQIDHLFHYYRNSIIFQPKTTILTGWNFPLNPFQFINPAVTTVVGQTAYVADQTILHQEAASKVSTGAATFADNFGLVVKAVAASGTRFALIQYMDTTTTEPYWSYNLSALVKLRFSSINNTTVKFKMLLMYRTIGAPPAISASEPIAGWSGNDLSVAAGWTVIKPINDPAYSVSTSISGANQSYVFNGFTLPVATSNTMYLAAVFYTVRDMSNVGTPDFFVIDSISLVNNDFAIDTQAQTSDDVLRQCQFYYEKSYDTGSYPSTRTFAGSLIRSMPVNRAGASFDGLAATFEFEFNTVKCAAPTVNLYAYNGAIDDEVGKIQATYYQNGASIAGGTSPNNALLSTFYNLPPGASTKSVYFISKGVGTTKLVTGLAYTDNASATITFQYTANALLGSPSGII